MRPFQLAFLGLALAGCLPEFPEFDSDTSDTTTTDRDDDGVLDVDDACPDDRAELDHDGDGCDDAALDDDDDNDGVLDEADTCMRGDTGWTSTEATDYDGDGCRDETEDGDDDDDGVSDDLDCQPRDETIHPGAEEACDGFDADCSSGGGDLHGDGHDAIYVDPDGGNASGNGSFGDPVATLSQAITLALAQDKPIFLPAGAFGGVQVTNATSDLEIRGGYDTCDWEADPSTRATTLRSPTGSTTIQVSNKGTLLLAGVTVRDPLVCGTPCRAVTCQDATLVLSDVVVDTSGASLDAPVGIVLDSACDATVTRTEVGTPAGISSSVGVHVAASDLDLSESTVTSGGAPASYALRVEGDSAVKVHRSTLQSGRATFYSAAMKCTGSDAAVVEITNSTLEAALGDEISNAARFEGMCGGLVFGSGLRAVGSASTSGAALYMVVNPAADDIVVVDAILESTADSGPNRNAVESAVAATFSTAGTFRVAGSDLVGADGLHPQASTLEAFEECSWAGCDKAEDNLSSTDYDLCIDAGVDPSSWFSNGGDPRFEVDLYGDPRPVDGDGANGAEYDCGPIEATAD